MIFKSETGEKKGGERQKGSDEKMKKERPHRNLHVPHISSVRPRVSRGSAPSRLPLSLHECLCSIRFVSIFYHLCMWVYICRYIQGELFKTSQLNNLQNIYYIL